MRANFFQSHATDTILGRQGFTLDWPKSIPNFPPKGWGNYIHAPPLGTDWRDHLRHGRRLVARNSVRPFAVFYEYKCDLVLMPDALFENPSAWKGTLNDVEVGEVVFGKRTLPYHFGRLKWRDVLNERDFSQKNRFSRIDFSRYHIHGTRVQRGQETSADMPTASEDNLAFETTADLKDARRKNLSSIFVPQHLEFRLAKASQPPQIVSIGRDVFVSEKVTEAVTAATKDPGMSFPYPPTSVEFLREDGVG